MKTAVSFTAVLRVLAQHTLGMLGLSCYLLADTFFVSNRLGADGLAALNLAIPLYSLLNGVGLTPCCRRAARRRKRTGPLPDP